jgi:non-homologous end joining protein Ku
MWCKVITAKQVNEMLASIKELVDKNDKPLSPFQFTETYDEMIAELMRRDPPEIFLAMTTNSVTVTRGCTWPLQLLLTDNLEMEREGMGYTKWINESDTSAAEMLSLADEIVDMATTFGWRVNRED